MTASFLCVRLICRCACRGSALLVHALIALLALSFMMEYDIHTVLDGLTLTATVGVVFCMLLQPAVKQTYQRDQDKLYWYLVVSAI